jgi:hypothetical protein
MRKILLLLLTSLCYFSAHAQDSRWELNAFARPNISDYKGGNAHKKFYNTDWGLEGKFHFNSHLRLVGGVGVATRRYDDNHSQLVEAPGFGMIYTHMYLKSTYITVRVPLKFEYIFFPHERVRFFINAGVISNYLLQQDIYSNMFTPENQTYRPGKRFGLQEDLTVGAGCEVAITKKISFYAEPTYERWLLYISHYGGLLMGKTYSYGLQTGVSYRF